MQTLYTDSVYTHSWAAVVLQYLRLGVTRFAMAFEHLTSKQSKMPKLL